ncbi:MAG: hypothetical protein CMJ58_10995 [Planctomycetaceae bacterium]|nr:hypothetical protein [Planctomycetaceae bacterium]
MLPRFRRRRVTPLALFGWLLAPLWAAGCQAQEAAVAPVVGQLPEDAGEHWVRLVEKKGQADPIAMETALIRYVPRADFDADRPVGDYERFVDLVGAVHIADRSYYDELNKRFRGYDAVLYELVAPEGTVVPKGRGTSNSHPLGAMQNMMKSALELEHQLEQVDYTARNFVHADMSPEQFMQSMADRNDNFLKMYLRMVGASMAQQSQNQTTGESPEMDLIMAFMSDDRPRRLKIAMAKQFEGMESLLTGFSGPEGSTIITERNKAALAVLREQLDEGTGKLAVFYGAGHLSDMHQRLIDEFDMQPIAQEWLQAWDLRAK